MKNQMRFQVFQIFVIWLFLYPYSVADAKNFKEIQQEYVDKEFYLQHNLWFRDNGKIYWFNYILAGEFIPIGSKVTITKVKTSTIKFKVEGREGKFYIKMWNCRPSYEKIIGRIFGETPPILDDTNEFDKKGILNGKVSEGMSRKGMFFAVGYPPYIGSSEVDIPVNANLNANELTYWKNRFDRIIYYFDENNMVINIRD